jgi:hypothetical protein
MLAKRMDACVLSNVHPQGQILLPDADIGQINHLWEDTI